MILLQRLHHTRTKSTLGGSIYSYSLKENTLQTNMFSENHTSVQTCNSYAENVRLVIIYKHAIKEKYVNYATPF